MIDLNTGNISFDAFTIGAATRIVDIENFITRRARTLTSGAEPVALGTHKLDNKTWGVGAVFSPLKTKQVWLQMLEVKGIDPKSWSLENEQLRQQEHDAYLMNLCHGASGSVDRSVGSLKYSFAWGGISSILDIRGVRALIFIEFD